MDVPNRSVLIVERDSACAAAWRVALEHLGVSVSIVSDAGPARASTGHAVVVIGALANTETAIDLARSLLAQPAASRPRVVIVTREPLRRIDRVHLDAVLERPVRTEVLLEHVRRLLDLSRTPRERRDSPRRFRSVT